MKKTFKISLIMVLISLFFYSRVSQGLTRYSPAGGYYTMDLVSSNAVLASTPTVGSNGVNYYSISPPNQEGIVINRDSSQPSGQVFCKENYLEGNYTKGLTANFAFHRVFAYMPEAGFTLKGLPAYKINSNTYFTLYSDNGITQGWKNITGRVCSSELNMDGAIDTGRFVAHFPFEVRIYVKDTPLDGKVVIPSAMIAGYTRMFQYPGTPDMYIPPDNASVKLNLNQSVIRYPSKCQSVIDNVNINYNTLDSTNFSSRQESTVAYRCELARTVKVKFTLDYATDNDPQKRVPLRAGNSTIYSELTLYDPEHNLRGKTINTTIRGIKLIKIESNLSGLNAAPGKYKGNAWLIVTFL